MSKLGDELAQIGLARTIRELRKRINDLEKRIEQLEEPTNA